MHGCRTRTRSAEGGELERIAHTPRVDWAARLDRQGFPFHSVDALGEPQHDGRFHYWREDVAFRFDEAEVERLYGATHELHAMALDLVGAIVTAGEYGRFALPDGAAALIERSWQRGDLSLYGRMDFAWNGGDAPRLLEYNADTPTSLVESAVAQWFWKQDVEPAADQFNSIHEALVARWRDFRAMHPAATHVHALAMLDNAEDAGNAQYMLETAREAGLAASLIDVPDVGADAQGNFYDLDGRTIDAAFKLYPWEWALREGFASELLHDRVRWLEPPWKMLLSNKAVLALLWARHRGHPNLLPTYFDAQPLVGSAYVQKPLLSREGANVSIVSPERVTTTPGPYGAEGFVYQAYAPLPSFDAMHAVTGCWIVGDQPVGLCMREDAHPVTRNTSFFVPHYFA